MASKGYGFIALTGGGTGALDALDGTNLQDGDVAIVVVPGTQRYVLYTLDSDSGLAESSPLIISPNTNAGTKRWILTRGYSDAALMTYLSASTGAIARTATSKFDDFVSVKDFGATGDGITDDSAAFVLALAAVDDKGCIFFPPGEYVGTLSVADRNGLAFRGDNAVIVGPATGALNAVVEIKDCTSIKWDGISVSGSYNPDLVSAIWVYTDDAGGCSLNSFRNVNVIGAPIAWKFGDVTYPGGYVAENTVTTGFTYGCPKVAQVVGTQAVTIFNNYNLISGVGSGAGDFLTVERGVAEAVGGFIIISGGECQITNSATYFCFATRPIVDAVNGNQYGKISVTNCAVESASQLGFSDNTAPIATPTGGLIRLQNCTGYHSANSFPFIQTDSTYVGDVVVNACSFVAGVARSQPNVQCDNVAANITVDDRSFGTNFVQGLQGLVGGTLHFPFRQILRATDLNGMTIATGVVQLVHITENAGESVSRYAAQFNNSTGVFTTPTGGLKNVLVRCQFYHTGATKSELLIRINGTTLGANMALGAVSQTTFTIPALAAGDTVTVALNNLESGSLTANSSSLDQFDIFASN